MIVPEGVSYSVLIPDASWALENALIFATASAETNFFLPPGDIDDLVRTSTSQRRGVDDASEKSIPAGCGSRAPLRRVIWRFLRLSPTKAIMPVEERSALAPRLARRAAGSRGLGDTTGMASPVPGPALGRVRERFKQEGRWDWS